MRSVHVFLYIANFYSSHSRHFCLKPIFPKETINKSLFISWLWSNDPIYMVSIVAVVHTVAFFPWLGI